MNLAEEMEKAYHFDILEDGIAKAVAVAKKYAEEEKNKKQREVNVEKIIYCPVCGKKYHKGLYDFSFIHCNAGCSTVFDKKTGGILGLNSDFSRVHHKQKLATEV